MIGTALLVSLAVWLVVVLASRLSVRRSTSSGRGRGLAAALVFFLLLGMVAANPSEAHESHRPAVLALAGEGTASAIGNPLARLDGPLDRPQGSLEVRRAGHALSENYGYDERVRPVVARLVSKPAIVVSSGKRLGSGVPRSAKSKPLNYDAMTLLRVSHSLMATKSGVGAADDVVRTCFRSFGGETKVLMADGTTKPISEIAVGDMVLAQDPMTGERGPRKVSRLWVHDDDLVRLEIDGDIVRTTEDHPFWNDTDGEWQRADQLGSGELVLTADGRRVRVGVLMGSAGRGLAYNLTVEGLHTYHVLFGIDAVLVHNVCGDDLVSDILKGKKGSIRQAPLPEGAPAWDDVLGMSYAEIEAAANANTPGFKTIKKLLTDKRFNK